MKKYTFKKQLAILLTIAILLSFMPITVMADDPIDHNTTLLPEGMVWACTDEQALACTQTEHTHTAQCDPLGTGTPQCGIPVHTHTEDCYKTAHTCKMEPEAQEPLAAVVQTSAYTTTTVTANLDHIDVYHKGYLTIITKINGVPQGTGVKKDVAISNVTATLVDTAVGVNASYSGFTNRSQNGEQEYHKTTVKFSRNAVITINATMTLDGVSRPITKVISGASMDAAIQECPGKSGADIRLSDEEIINTFTHTVTFKALGGGTLEAGSVTNKTIRYENLSDNATFPARPTTIPDTNYAFVKWYADEDCTSEAVFPTHVTEDSIWYAKFEALPEYKYQVVDHFILSVNGSSSEAGTESGEVITSTTGGTRTASFDVDSKTYNGLSYAKDPGNSNNVLSVTLVSGQTKQLHRYWKRTETYKYKIIDHFMRTLNGTTVQDGTESTGELNGDPAAGSATATFETNAKTYNGRSYDKDPDNGSNVLSAALVNGTLVELHRYWKRTEDYKYKIIDHFVLTLNGVVTEGSTSTGELNGDLAAGSATASFETDTKTYNGRSYDKDPDNGSNVLSVALVNGSLVELHRYWKRTETYKYKIVDHFVLTINGTTSEQTESTGELTGDPSVGSASTTFDVDSKLRDGLSYDKDPDNGSNVLSAALVNGSLVELHRYWKRTAVYQYQVIDHFTLIVNGVRQTSVEVSDGAENQVQTVYEPGEAATTTTPGFKPYGGVTYTFESAHPNNKLSAQLKDGELVKLHRYWVREAVYQYRITDHFTLIIDDTPQTEETTSTDPIDVAEGGAATCTEGGTQSHNGVDYTYDDAANNITQLELKDGEVVELHRYWVRTAVYQYQLNLHYTVNSNGAETTDDVSFDQVTVATPDTVTFDPDDYLTHTDGFTYAYTGAGVNGTSKTLEDGQTIVFDLYFTRTRVFKYQINRHYTTLINGTGPTVDVVGAAQTTGDPADIVVNPDAYVNYEGKTFTFDAQRSGSLTIVLIDGDTVVVDLYYTRGAQFSYTIIRHYTTYTDGVPSGSMTASDGVVSTGNSNASQSANPALYATYNGVTYTFTSATGNPTGTLVDGVTAEIHLHYAFNDIPLNPPDDDDDEIPLGPSAGDPNDLAVFVAIAGAAIAAILGLVILDKKNKTNA